MKGDFIYEALSKRDISGDVMPALSAVSHC